MFVGMEAAKDTKGVYLETLELGKVDLNLRVESIVFSYRSQFFSFATASVRGPPNNINSI